MAAKSRRPTKLGEKQLAQTLERVFDGKAQFVPHKRAREWFGRMDSAATEKVQECWKACCTYAGYSGWDAPGPMPKLLVGELSKPKGFMFVRGDKTKEWLQKIT